MTNNAFKIEDRQDRAIIKTLCENPLIVYNTIGLDLHCIPIAERQKYLLENATSNDIMKSFLQF